MSAERTRGSMFTAHTTITCDFRQPNGDGCHDSTAAKGDSAATVRRALKEMGWVRLSGKDYCPAHAKPLRPGEAPDGYGWARLPGSNRPVLLCDRCAGYVDFDGHAEHAHTRLEWKP